MKSINKILTVTIISLLTACAQTPTNSPEDTQQALEDAHYEAGYQVSRVLYSNIESWEYLDKYHMILKGRKDQNYLVAFKNKCQNFSRNAIPIFESHSGTLSKLDSIRMRNSLHGALSQFSSDQFCLIEDIIKLNPSIEPLAEDQTSEE